jgi:hypothetical protein
MTIDHIRPCDSHGPYLLESGILKRPTSEALTCNRPRGHEGDHIHYSATGHWAAVWSRVGRPVKHPAGIGVVMERRPEVNC